MVYKSTDGDDIGGLRDGETYIVIKVDDDRFRLARTPEDADDGTAITLDKTQATGASHRFEGSTFGSSASHAENQTAEFSSSLQGYEDPGDDASDPTDDGAHQQSMIAASAAGAVNANSPSGKAGQALGASGEAAKAGTTAYIGNGSTITAGDSVDVRAKERIEFNGLAGTASTGAVGHRRGHRDPHHRQQGRSAYRRLDDHRGFAILRFRAGRCCPGDGCDGEGVGRTGAASCALGAQVIVINDNSVQLAHIDSGADIAGAGGTVACVPVRIARWMRRRSADRSEGSRWACPPP